MAQSLVGKSLVKLGHFTTDTGQPLHQMHFKSHFGQVQRRLNPCNTAAYNEHIFIHKLPPL